MVSAYLMQIITTIISVPIGALVLWLVAKLFKKTEGYVTALTVVAIPGVIGLILNLIGIAAGFPAWLGFVIAVLLIILTIWLIMKYYKEGIGKSLLIWLVYFLISLVVGLVIGFILALIFVVSAVGALV